MNSKFNLTKMQIAIIILPIISMLIGFYGVKWFLVSDNNYDNNESNQISETTDIELVDEKKDIEEIKESKPSSLGYSFSKFEYYTIQMGSFSNKENAIEFVNYLNEKGISSYYIEKSNYYVYSYSSFDKDLLEDDLLICQNEISDSFIKKMIYTPASIEVDESDLSIIKSIDNEIIKHFNSLENLNKIYLINFKKVNELVNNLSNKDKIFGNIITAFFNEFNSKEALITNNNSDDAKYYQYLFLSKYIEIFR